MPKLKKEKKEPNFIKMQGLHKFKVFNPSCKECLTGTEWGVLMYILYYKLLYIRKDSQAYNGNTIKLDRPFKDELLEQFKMGQSSYERLMTKLVKGGVLYRIKKDWYAVNPYCFAKGRDLEITTEMCIFRESTLNLPEGASPFLNEAKKDKDKSTKGQDGDETEETEQETDTAENPAQETDQEGEQDSTQETPKRSPGTMNRFFKK